jgi:hypothetical protein
MIHYRTLLLPLFLAGITPAHPATSEAPRFAWQETPAEVLPNGDLRWQPQEFEFRAGPSVRYIDYENGDDRNSGTSPESAWKHHPWDPAAQSFASFATGSHTYVFKRGVTYRGRLIARDQGSDEQPIIFTSDPRWGEGEAILAGSDQVTGWARGGHPDMPDADRVWHTDINFLPRALWVNDAGSIRRIPLARTPNWDIDSWDDIHRQWATWKKTEPLPRNGIRLVQAHDPELLGRYTREQLTGAVVWSEYESVMGTAFPTHVITEDVPENAIAFERWVSTERQGAIAENRYFLEDRPAFLDAGDEYWFERHGAGGRLYIRLADDRDPTTVHIEAARHLAIIDATRLDHIHIRGLTFRFTNIQWDLTEGRTGNPDVEPAAIRLNGSGRDIVVEHCRFEYLTTAVRFVAAPEDGGHIEEVTIANNVVRETDHGAFFVSDSTRWGKNEPPHSTLGRVRVLRNNLEKIGFRPYRREHGHALVVRFASEMHIAGNFLDLIHGAGIFLFGGAGSHSLRDAPFNRHLVHHNRVDRPLLGTNDWGGIETWQSGPYYIFNNVSKNPGGYYHAEFLKRQRQGTEPTWNYARFGFAYYLDGAYKNYLFNNIAVGSNNDPASPLNNSSAFHEVLPQQNVFFNNSAFRFSVAFAGGVRTASNGIFVGNLLEDMSLAGWYFAWPQGYAEALNEIQFTQLRRGTAHREELVIANNIFSGPPATLGTPPGVRQAIRTLPDFREALTRSGVSDARVGEIVPRGVMPGAETNDFRPAANSAAAGKGAQVFLPWGLYACVAEWNFRPRQQNPEIVPDDHWYIRYGYTDRGQYAQIPRHALQGVNIDQSHFTSGPLDSWMPTVLQLDGQSQYLVLRDRDLYRPTQIDYLGDNSVRKKITVTRENWRTPDIGTGNLLIETFFRAEQNRGGTLVAKHDGRTGYVLELTEAGHVQLRLEHDGALVAQRSSTHPITNGDWRHVVVELDRTKADGITLWIDGQNESGALTGAVTAVDLDNAGDVLVGGGPGQTPLKAELDFLRICLGTLADANTTIEELRAWQFSGPQFADFAGRPRPRDGITAGALEPLAP